MPFPCPPRDPAPRSCLPIRRFASGKEAGIRHGVRTLMGCEEREQMASRAGRRWAGHGSAASQIFERDINQRPTLKVRSRHGRPCTALFFLYFQRLTSGRGYWRRPESSARLYRHTTHSSDPLGLGEFRDMSSRNITENSRSKPYALTRDQMTHTRPILLTILKAYNGRCSTLTPLPHR